MNDPMNDKFTRKQIADAIAAIDPENCPEFRRYSGYFWNELCPRPSLEPVDARTGDRVRGPNGQVTLVAGLDNAVGWDGYPKLRYSPVGTHGNLWFMGTSSQTSTNCFYTTDLKEWEVEVNGQWHPIKDVHYLDGKVTNEDQ